MRGAPPMNARPPMRSGGWALPPRNVPGLGVGEVVGRQFGSVECTKSPLTASVPYSSRAERHTSQYRVQKSSQGKMGMSSAGYVGDALAWQSGKRDPHTNACVSSAHTGPVTSALFLAARTCVMTVASTSSRTRPCGTHTLMLPR
jgi:hypothetical protein